MHLPPSYSKSYSLYHSEHVNVSFNEINEIRNVPICIIFIFFFIYFSNNMNLK